MEAENKSGDGLHHVERLLMEARMANARLMEDNESYQLLLQERTLNGDFVRELDHLGSGANMDTLNALEGRAPTSLADELSQSEADGMDVSPESHKRLETELKAAKDSNKALTLYINKIIERLLQHQEFEAILDQSSDFNPALLAGTPPPPPPKDQAGSMLQRARTVAIATAQSGSASSMTKKPRPQSQMIAKTTSTGNTNPDTAPSIPFGLARSNSVRPGPRPMSEQFTPGAANIVAQMYKGGTSSPPLHGPQTPRHSQSFFATTGPTASTGPNQAAQARRAPNSGPLPSTATFASSSSRSEEAGSISGDSGEVTTPPPQHSPRPSAGSEKDRGDRKEGMASFMGGKPRPLRLVIDREEKEKEEAARKRTSWMGWAWNGATSAITPTRREDDGLP